MEAFNQALVDLTKRLRDAETRMALALGVDAVYVSLATGLHGTLVIKALWANGPEAYDLRREIDPLLLELAGNADALGVVIDEMVRALRAGA